MSDYIDRILRQANDRPSHFAVISDSERVTYGEFAQRAWTFASCCGALAQHPRIVIALPQGGDAYAAMVGIALAGGYYVPVNVTSPIERHQAIVEQFAPDAIVTTPHHYQLLAHQRNRIPLIDPKRLPAAARTEPRSRHTLAYVIFTSGSTGVPKGVPISASALGHYVDWALEAMAVKPTDRWSQHPNLGFDLSVLDIYGALCGGATLFPLVGATDRLMPATAIRRHELTIWNSVPSVVSLMMQAKQITREDLASLRLMTFCGEPLLPEHLDAIFNARPDMVVHNTYGPTEATVSCTLLQLTRDNYERACDASVAIGEAIPGMALHLRGGDGVDEGEIVITGPQLAQGYWNDPGATARSFRPLDGQPGAERAYWTGDWAARRNGHLFFLGRRDFQIKIKGYRLELEEVDAAVRRCGVAHAQSIYFAGCLHTFVEGEARGLDVAELRTKLSMMLEPHAIPAQFHCVPSLPRSANDKIDTMALKKKLAEIGDAVDPAV